MIYNLNDYGDILSTEDVRKILRIGANRAYELLKTGEIKNFKIGSVRRIPKQCLLEYIERSIHKSEKGDADDSGTED